MTNAAAGYGTILPDGASALVVYQMGQLNFYMAKGAEVEDLQQMVQLLAAVLVRSEDPEWVADMIASLDALDPS